MQAVTAIAALTRVRAVLVIARTVAHLFRQLRAQERPLADLVVVRRAYDLGTPLHSARFEVDGTPFHVHGLGVASIASQLGAPAAVVGAAVLHNAYNTGDWGDGRANGPAPARCQRIRDEVSPEVERCLTALYAARRAHVLGRALEGAEVSDDERWLVVLDMADFLDKWDDGRIAYGNNDREDRVFVDAHQAQLVTLASQLGWPELGTWLDDAFTRLAEDELPEELRLGRRYSTLVPPPSLRPSLAVNLTRRARRARHVVRRLARR